MKLFHPGHIPSDITYPLAFRREEYFANVAYNAGRHAGIAIDNCFNCTLEGAVITHRKGTKSRHSLVIADHSDNIWIDGLVIKGRPRGAEIVIGWRPGLVPSSDWNRCGSVVLRDVTCDDGKPVRVTVWDAPMPYVQGGNVEVRMMNPRYVRAAQWLNRKGLLP